MVIKYRISFCYEWAHSLTADIGYNGIWSSIYHDFSDDWLDEKLDILII